MRAPFRLSGCSNGQNFLPTREPALGEPFLAHPPAARPSLDSEDQRLSAKDAINGIDDRHQAHLAIVVNERYLPEKIRLHDRQRRDAAEHHACCTVNPFGVYSP
jgi:hypothetical protein